MNRGTLERITASIVIFLMTLFTLALTLVIANLIFSWDIFPPFMEQVLYFIISVAVLVTLASAVINIMLNISRMAYYSEVLAHHFLREREKGKDVR